jgi:hypothetical protein
MLDSLCYFLNLCKDLIDAKYIFLLETVTHQ